MKQLIFAVVALPLATTAFAQTGTGPAEIRQPGPPTAIAPAEATGTVVKPGGIDNSGPGSIGTAAPGGTGASSISNNSGAAGNAEHPERPIGNTGGGGSGGQ
ncbi:hypothetical protein [Methylobacterium planeticum]|uniref:Uncharacterized protein n=1 Tax=Methylobacterium planeticum TaxID=2615211 RepID=A0A6N6MEU5_9HYPH|nr:hypothetical protein [Methylobacterium planeticum]KAB1069325.1 hypothetical protein F6X51_25435 [Methylobacterium planeticum]